MKAFLVRSALIFLSFILLVQLWIFSSLVWWRTNPVNSTMMMRLDYWSDSSVPIKHQWRDYDNISTNFKKAIVAAEDGKFMQHHGFDWDGMRFALDKNKDKGKVVAGGSTISQQLSKNLFLFKERSFIRKGQEAIATWMMERVWSKRRILEVYMNSVEFGDNIYGVEAASQHYFGIDAKSMSRDQAAYLAALLPNPKYYDHHRGDGRLMFKKRFVLKYMGHSEIPE